MIEQPSKHRYLQHVLHKHIAQHCKDKGFEWNHRLTVHGTFPSARIEGHWVDACLSPIDLLSIASHYFLAILNLAKTIEMQVRERTIVQNIEKW
jgi:hypothetical protein